jgi:hypothetical protein
MAALRNTATNLARLDGYYKLAVRYDATVQITHINIWLRDLSNRA